MSVQIVPKWKVTITYAVHAQVVFWVSETHFSNVLRRVAELQFTESGLEQPNAIIIAIVGAGPGLD